MTSDPAAAWAALAGRIRTCTRCPLAAGRIQAVPGDLPAAVRPGAGLLLVGEAPGADEDRLGRPFVGRSGQLLDTLLADVGLARADVAVANVLKCRPPGNRAPRAAEVATCRPWLTGQLQVLDPAVVLALGSTAVQWFWGRGARLGAVRGQVLEWSGPAGGTVRVLASYHPSAALRFGPAGPPRLALAADLATAARLLAAGP